MEDELQEKLQRIYEGFIKVKFRDFGVYDIFLSLKGGQMLSVVLNYDCRNTLESNVSNAIMKLDSELLKLHKIK